MRVPSSPYVLFLSYLTAEAVCAEYITGYMDGLGFSGVVAAVVAGIYLAATSRTSVVDEGSMESVYVCVGIH